MMIRILAALVAAFLLQIKLLAATDYLLFIDGIRGESTDARHPDSIEISSFEFGVLQQAGTGGSTTSRAAFTEISFSKQLDKSSPLLYLNCASGKRLKKAVLYVRKPADRSQDYYVITLEDVLISSIQTSGSGSDVPSSESFKLSFTKIDVSYRPQKADGSLDAPVRFGWDLAANRPF